MSRKFESIVLCFLMAACSSSGEGGAGNAAGGSSASGGTAAAGGTSAAGTGAGGGSAAGAPAGGGPSGNAVVGAFSVNIQAASGCALTAQSQDFPIVAGGHPVTATSESGGIAAATVDASGYPANVYCSWYSDSSPYMINAGLMLGPSVKSRTVSVNTLLVQGTGSTGGFGFHTDDLPDVDYSGQCNFTVIQIDLATRSVWGSFTCDSLDKFASDGATQVPTQCKVGPSYFYFKNCTKP
jgi:hypothetical protein